MKFFQINSFFSWDQFYDNTSEPTNNKLNGTKYNETRPTLDSSNAYVFDCFFLKISHTDKGAAIFLNAENVHFLVEYSSFFQCSVVSSESWGGTITVMRADSAMNCICGMYCYSQQYGSFAYIVIGPRTKNILYESSISCCEAKDKHTIAPDYGSIEVKSLNMSNNTANLNSALWCAPDQDKSDFGTKLSFSSFADNNSSSYCVFLQHAQYSTTKSKNYKIEYTNII